jgi:hypothetical protein
MTATAAASAETLSKLDKVEAEALTAWRKYRRSEPLGEEFGAKMYALQQELTAQGKKDGGLKAWLQQNDIPRSTAYFWIHRHRVSIGECVESEPTRESEPTNPPFQSTPISHEAVHTYPVEDYEPEQQVKAAGSRSHGKGLERLRKITGELDLLDKVKISHDGDNFRIAVIHEFDDEGEAKKFLRTFAKTRQ